MAKLEALETQVGTMYLQLGEVLKILAQDKVAGEATSVPPTASLTLEPPTNHVYIINSLTNSDSGSLSPHAASLPEDLGTCSNNNPLFEELDSEVFA